MENKNIKCIVNLCESMCQEGDMYFCHAHRTKWISLFKDCPEGLLLPVDEIKLLQEFRMNTNIKVKSKDR